MDSACDAAEIKDCSRRAGKVAIIDADPRRDRELKAALAAKAGAQRVAGCIDPKAVRYNERSTVERADARLMDEFGGRRVRIRGHARALCRPMFGIVAPAVDQLIRTPGQPTRGYLKNWLNAAPPEARREEARGNGAFVRPMFRPRSPRRARSDFCKLLLFPTNLGEP